MLRSLNSLERYTVTATDGDVGTVSDFLVDDRANAVQAIETASGTRAEESPRSEPAGERRYTWAVRYLIVQTGGFFHRRRVLVSPISVRDVDATERRYRLSLTTEKIRNSPSFDADKPVSRAHERAYFQYYQYPYYWDYSGLWGMGAVPGVLATALDDAPDLRDDRPTEPYGDPPSETSETHLRSAREILGYHVQAEDGMAGHVEDLLVDDESYEVRAIVVNTGSAGLGHRVLLAPSEVARVSWEERNLYVGAWPPAGGANGVDGESYAAHEALGAAGGALTGGILGSIAGPPGVAAGVILGGVAGAVTEAALESGAVQDVTRERELDAELGISGGDIGAKNLRHPPPKRGAYSGASSGASVGAGGSSGEAPAEGPIPSNR